MKTKTVPRSWLDINGYRLDSQPYLQGGIEAKVHLTKLPVKKDLLCTVTKDGMDGIFNGPRFARLYVQEKQHGVPFLGSTDILAADFSTLPLLSKKIVNRYPKLLIEETWTLITCSGTIGRMAYARAEMHGMAGTQHFMRVVPDPDQIPPGYLFSFLSSRFGVPMVISGTYGAIIQHIEPQHIADLPVPRLGKVEQQSHDLCMQAADMRTQASAKLQEAQTLINHAFGFPHKLALSHRNFSVSIASSTLARSRLEATYHDQVAQESDRILANLKRTEILHKVANIGETGRIKQIFVDPDYGVPFLTSGELFLLQFEPRRYLSKKLLAQDGGWKIEEGDILLARSGQVGGIIGRSVWADKRFENLCVSVDVIRIRSHKQKILPGYLFAYLNLTDIGYRQLVRTAAGSSIPHIAPDDVRNLRIPRTSTETEGKINDLVWQAGNLRAEAQEKEDQARQIVEQAVEEG
jgi:type I restriction enzyme S subunit